MQVPPVARESDAKMGGGKVKPNKRLPIVLAAAAVGGLLVGFVLRPVVTTDSRVGELEGKVTDADKATTSARAHADELQKDLDKATGQRDEAQKSLHDAESSRDALADKAAAVDKKAKDVAAEEAKLRATIDKSQGSVTSEGDEIHLQLVDHILFKTGDDQLTDKGKQVLDKVAVALRDLPDQQIWVQGHTDDQPIFVPPPKPVPGKPVAKPAVKDAAPPPQKFTTNWELSAARALQVVHYLQDTSKIEPTRLAAVAFGQYRPVSHSNKAQNRRIEIVLYPKRVVAK